MHLQVANVVNSKLDGGLGMDLDSTPGGENSSAEMLSRHFIKSILPDGAVAMNGLVHVDDELLAVSIR